MLKTGDWSTTKYKIVKHKCPRCGHKKARLVATCITYDEYFICENCGHCDFSASKKLTPEENEKRELAIEKFMKHAIVDGWKVGVREKTDREIEEQLNRTDIINERRSILMNEQKLRERTAKVKVQFS